MRSKQYGFLSPIAIAVLVVLLALLLVPLWWNNKNTKARQVAEQAEKTQLGELAANSAPREVALNANGLTWGFMPKPRELEGDMVLPGCHGEPKTEFDLPHSGSCNPYKGDTSCRKVLPVLCIKRWRTAASSDGASQPTLAVGIDERIQSEVASTEPVAGFILDSLAATNARCEKELGTGWRMANFHDGGWEGVSAKKGIRLYTSQRHWVNIDDQKGNCWDPAN